MKTLDPFLRFPYLLLFVISAAESADRKKLAEELKKKLPEQEFEGAIWPVPIHTTLLNPGLGFVPVSKETFTAMKAEDKFLEFNIDGEEWYGLSSEMVEAVFKRGMHGFICADVDTVKALKTQFGSSVYSLFLQTERGEGASDKRYFDLFIRSRGGSATNRFYKEMVNRREKEPRMEVKAVPGTSPSA